MARRRRGTLRYAFLAVGISMVLWSIAHGGSTVEREFDIPVVFSRLPEDLVITDQTATKINVRVQGSRAAFRALVVSELEYVENVVGAKPGRARYEVGASELPADLTAGLLEGQRGPLAVEASGESGGEVVARGQTEVAAGAGLRKATLCLQPVAPPSPDGAPACSARTGSPEV